MLLTNIKRPYNSIFILYKHNGNVFTKTLGPTFLVTSRDPFSYIIIKIQFPLNFPIQLVVARSIHHSQGLSLEELAFDLTHVQFYLKFKQKNFFFTTTSTKCQQ